MTYQPKVYREQGGNKLVCAAGGEMQIDGDLTLHNGAIAGIVGNTFFVDSGDTDAADAAAGGTSAAPFATLDYAVGQCTANNGDVIIVRPGHVEDLATGESIDFDIAGITVIGLGRGTDRPRIDFNHANGAVDIGADNVTLRNLTFRPSVTVVAIGVDIEAGAEYALIEDCEFLDGEAGDGTDEFVIGIDLKAGCHHTRIRNCKFSTHASANGAEHAILLTGASHHVVVVDCDIRGEYTTACVGGITTLSTDILIVGNILQPLDTEPGIELLTGTTGIVANNYIATDLATKLAAIAADAVYLFENYYCEAVTETGGIIGAASADD